MVSRRSPLKGKPGDLVARQRADSDMSAVAIGGRVERTSVWIRRMVGGVRKSTFESERALEVALQLFRMGSPDFAGCLHVASVTPAGEAPLWTFERGAAKIGGAQLLAKA